MTVLRCTIVTSCPNGTIFDGLDARRWTAIGYVKNALGRQSIGRNSTQPFRHKPSNRPVTKNYRCAILCDVVRFRFSVIAIAPSTRALYVCAGQSGDPHLSTCGSGSTLHPMTDLTLEMLREELAPIRAELAAMRPHVDGIPVIQRAVTVLQRDVQSLRDDMRVLTSLVLRLDGNMNNLSQEMHVTHEQISRMNDRIRKLEDAE